MLTGTSHGYTSFFRVTATTESSPDYYTLTAKTTRLTLALGQIVSGDTALTLDELLYLFVQETPDITAYVQSVPLTLADQPATAWSLDPSYPRMAGMLTPVAGSSVTVTGGQQIAPGQPAGCPASACGSRCRPAPSPRRARPAGHRPRPARPS